MPKTRKPATTRKPRQAKAAPPPGDRAFPRVDAFEYHAAADHCPGVVVRLSPASQQVLTPSRLIAEGYTFRAAAWSDAERAQALYLATMMLAAAWLVFVAL